MSQPCYEPFARSDNPAKPVSKPLPRLVARVPVPRPALPPTPAQYAPGRLRSESDAEHALVSAFKSRFPDFARLSHDELLQLAATYLSEDDHRRVALLAAEGVPEGWKPEDGDMSLEHGSDYL